MTNELHVEVFPGQGPPLLLVHGMLSSRAQWEPNLEALAAVSTPVIVEVLGHGRSPAPEDPALYHPDAYLEAFEALRESLGAERWSLCGQSFGACFTLRYALRYPERVFAQIFTNSTSALADAEQEERVGRQIEKVIAAVEQKGRAGLEGLGFHPRHAQSLPEAAKRALVREAEQLDPGGVVRTLRHTVPDASVYREIGQNRVPTLLVCGTRETRFERFRQHAESAMPKLEVACFDAGHAVNIEAAEAFNAVVSAFLSRWTASN